ncbi:hypothetical protein [Denitratimonas tolerans]|jgi:hypothetical protein|uniref:Uncharacterized protein n=1 Tax=Denitratimonas tolerans TaxID=1338420 RepID=A0AAW9RAF6_9GAMM
MISKIVATENAQAALKGIMIGAYLDEIRAHSIQATLRFFSDQVCAGKRVTVDLVLTCEARVISNNLSVGDGEEDFFSERARFLSRAYGLIGKEIVDINLQDNGALTIKTETSSILLWLSSDDLGDDDWVWKVEHEEDTNLVTGGANPIYCMPEGDGVHFYFGG